MDFVRIRDDVFLKILQHLRFDERVRLARVSRRFREMSDLAVSQTKFLDLGHPMFKKATPDKMEQLIAKCAESLERVTYTLRLWPYQIVHYPSPDYRLVLLSKVRCPRLVRLDIGGVENDVLRDLLVNRPNLREFNYYDPTNPVFPVACEKMETVDVRLCKVGFMLSLTSQCPNLTSLGYEAIRGEAESQFEQLLDEMLANVPNLETLKLMLIRRSYQCANMGNFMKLSSLRSLGLICGGITDESPRKISKSFGQLERLRIVDPTPNNASLTSSGLRALSSLENLRDFTFVRGRLQGSWQGPWPFIDDGIRLLASRGRLQLASFPDEIVDEQTMVTFVQCCPELRVKNVAEIRRRKHALRMLEKFAGFQQPNVAIRVRYPRVDWNRGELKAALDRINVSADGRRIEIYGETDVFVPFTANTEESSSSGDESDDESLVTAMEAGEE